MTKEQIYSWVRQTSEMYSVLNSQLEMLDKIRAHIEISESTGKGEMQAQLSVKLGEVLKEVELITETLLRRTKVRSSDRIADYIVDMQLRVNHMNDFFENWRKAFTKYEVISEGSTIDDDTRQKSMEMISYFEKQYDTAKKVVEQSIPNTVEIIRV